MGYVPEDRDGQQNNTDDTWSEQREALCKEKSRFNARNEQEMP